jgi:manganese transport protein
LFAIALIAAGQSSTVTGTLAGQIVMEGYLHIRINPWLRRIITRAVAVIPAFITILIAGENKMTDLLILSQVVLSVQLAFAVIPLIYAVSNKQMMKNFVIKPWLIVLSVLIAAVILFLNIKMVLGKAIDFIHTSDSLLYQSLVITGLILFTILLLLTIFYPLLYKKKHLGDETIHQRHQNLNTIEVPDYHRIALALDFSRMDDRVISHGLKQGTTGTTFLLIHVVESAGAKLSGQLVADDETMKDNEQLKMYANKLKEMGKEASIHLGYRNRVNEIARICKEEQADLLIMGAHGHSGIADFVYGHTIESVRHKVNIPVLIVS